MTDTETGVPQTTDQMKRALEDGQCFKWEYYNRRMYFHFAEGVGFIYTETDEHGHDPFTTAASDTQMKTALRYGGVERVERHEIPRGEPYA